MAIVSWDLGNRMWSNRREIEREAEVAGEAGGGWEAGGWSVVLCSLFVFYSLKASVDPAPCGWPGNSVSLAYPMTDSSCFSGMRSSSHGLVSKGQVPGVLCCRQCPEANSPAAEKGGNWRLLSQGLWACRQRLEQQLNEMRSFNASVPPAASQASSGGWADWGCPRGVRCRGCRAEVGCVYQPGLGGKEIRRWGA